jgi:hypothetical protein
MPLNDAQNQQLKRDLLKHWKHMVKVTGQKFLGLHQILDSKNTELALRGLSSRQTSGLAWLFEHKKENLSIEKFILDSEWADKIDPAIKRLCQKNLEPPKELKN